MPDDLQPHTSHRRGFLKAVGLGASMTALPAAPLLAQSVQPPPRPASAPPASAIATRTIARTKEAVPAIGLGTFMTFDLIPGSARAHLLEVVRRFWEAGGRVIDTSPLYGMSEVNVGHFLSTLGINDQVFISNKIWSTGEYLGDASHGDRSVALSRQRLWRERIDLMQCHSLVNVDVIVPLLHALKREGKIRFLGVTHHDPAYFEPLASWVETGNLDFVQVHYSIAARQAEARVLPAAMDHGVSVNVNMPLEKARLHKIVQGHPLPGFAKELGIQSWAAYFLKWVISHPAITCALPATTNPDHLVENMAALTGPLPDQAMRERMARHMETIPGFNTLASMPWYPDKTFPGAISAAQRTLRGRAAPQ